MLEIVFSESACGALKLAQHYGEGKYRGGAIGVIARNEDGSTPSEEELGRLRHEAEGRERRAWERAVPLGGQREDVFCFGLALSVGDVAPEAFWENRRAALSGLWGRWDEGYRCETLGRALQTAQAALETVRKRLSAGEPMRIWHSAQQDEACGLRWLLAALAPWRGARGDVLLVELPAYCEDAEDACLRSFRDWGDVNIEYWGRFAKRQRAVSPRLCAALANEWRAVEAENAPLRALVGGRLRSLPEDAYDLSIRRALAEAPREFREGRLIGDILGRYALDVSDGWLAMRLEAMVQSGELAVVQEAGADRPYSRVLRRAVH